MMTIAQQQEICRIGNTNTSLSENDSDSDDDDDEIPILLDMGNHSEENDAIDNTSSLPRVPVTILSGFLGSGKTTLIKYILNSHDHKLRIAVIENEIAPGLDNDSSSSAPFGDSKRQQNVPLSVETMIAKDGTSSAMSSLADLIELPNGCICCTVKDSLVETLELLLGKRQDFDYILIECSGMANPGPIASVFWLDEALESRIRLDGIVTMVDSRNIVYQLEETRIKDNMQGHSNTEDSDDGGGEAAQQIAFADRIIVNKTDLLGSKHHQVGSNSTTRVEQTLENVLAEIRSINSSAPLMTTTYSKVPDLSWILQANCFDVERAKDVEISFQKAAEEKQMKDFTAGVLAPCGHVACRPSVVGGPTAGVSDNLAFSNFCGVCCVEEEEDDDSSSLKNRKDTHTHTSSVSTAAFISPGSVDLKAMNSWLATILWPDQDVEERIINKIIQEKIENDEIDNGEQNTKQGKTKIYRVKGILSVQHPMDEHGNIADHLDDPNDVDFIVDGGGGGLDCRRYIVQAVNDLWDIKPASESLNWMESEERCCKLVVIGRWLNEAELKAGFNACFLPSSQV